MLNRTRNYGLAGGWLTPPSVMTCPLCDGVGVLGAALPRQRLSTEEDQ